MNEESYLTHFTVFLRMNVAVSRRILAGVPIVCMLQQCCMHMAHFVQQGLGEKLSCFLSHPTVLISLQQSFWFSRTERQFIMMSVCVSRGNARETARTVDSSFFRILCGMLGKIKVLVLFVETTLRSQCMQWMFFWRLHIIQNPHNRRLIFQ